MIYIISSLSAKNWCFVMNRRVR